MWELVATAWTAWHAALGQNVPAELASSTSFGDLNVVEIQPSWKGSAIFTQFGQVTVPGDIPFAEQAAFKVLLSQGNTWWKPKYQPPSVILREEQIGVFSIEDFSDGGGACALRYHPDWSYGMSGGAIMAQVDIVGVLATGNSKEVDYAMASGEPAMTALVDAAKKYFP